jgi:hypothetical protein
MGAKPNVPNLVPESERSPNPINPNQPTPTVIPNEAASTVAGALENGAKQVDQAKRK